jgi:PAS domain S-box-containing protein
VLSLASIFFTAWLTYNHIKKLDKSSKLLINSYEVKINLEKLLSHLKDSETGFRGYLLYTDKSFYEPFEKSREKVDVAFYKIKRLSKGNSTQLSNLKQLYKLISIRYYYFKSYNHELNDFKVDTDFGIKSKIAMDNIRVKIDEMVKLEEYLHQKREQSFNDNSFYTSFYAFMIVMVTLILIVLSYNRINKNLNILEVKNNKLLITNESQKLAETIGKFGSWEINLDKNIYRFSDNLYRLLGYEPNEFEPTLEEYIKTIHPDDLEMVQQKSANILAQKELPGYTYRIIKKNGAIRYFYASGIIIKNNFDETLVVGSTQDVTESREYTEKIKKSNQSLKIYNKQLKIYDESSKQAEILGEYGSWILNLKTLKLSYSDNKYRLLGCEPQSFEPTIEKLLEFIHPDDRSIIIEGNKSIIEQELLPTMSYRIIKSTGEIRNLRTTAKIYIDSLGNKNMIGTTEDVTDEIINTQILKQKNQELERSNKELIEFNYAASHDLQEPLRKIQTFISRINDKEFENLSDRGKEYMARIVNAADRMRILIDDLLQYSRTNKSDALFEKIDLNEALETITQDLSELIIDNNVIINASKLPVVYGIRFQMQQLFVNLIGNSVKYRKPTVKPIITISYEKVKAKNENINDDTHAEFHKITFADNGIGFEPEHAQKIFLLFNRLHSKSEYPGTGLGLAICKKIISNHNGYIFAAGKLGEGATITIYIPTHV